jgi:hypothetical protein
MNLVFAHFLGKVKICEFLEGGRGSDQAYPQSYPQNLGIKQWRQSDQGLSLFSCCFL